jgi:hypothetical protein
MTRYELELAQSLYRTWGEALQHADHVDPRRLGPKRLRSPFRSELVIYLDTIARNAASAFRTLTGKLPSEVDFEDLHTEEPAFWTRARTYGLR